MNLGDIFVGEVLMDSDQLLFEGVVFGIVDGETANRLHDVFIGRFFEPKDFDSAVVGQDARLDVVHFVDELFLWLVLEGEGLVVAWADSHR